MKHDIIQTIKNISSDPFEPEFIQIYRCQKCDKEWSYTEGYPARGCTVKIKRGANA